MSSPSSSSSGSSSRTVSFEHLNEDCMIAIMRSLHVVDRFPLRLVSRRWQTIIDGTFRTQHSLKIFDDYLTMLDCYRAFNRCDSFLEPNYLSKFKLDEIFPRKSASPSNGDKDDIARSTESNNLSVMMRFFPNINRLIVGLGSSQNIELASLLRSFPQLQSLTLLGQSKSNGDAYSLSAAATQAINEMRLLKHFKLFCFDLSPNSVAMLSQLTIFEQLESLEISNCCTAPIDQKFDFVSPLLERLNRQRFRRLALNQLTLDEEQLVAIFDNNRDLLQNVTHLALNVRLREEQLEKLDAVQVNFHSNEKMIYTVMTERVAKLVLDYFPALTSLQCTLPGLLLGEASNRLLDHLRAIPNLTDLAVFLVKNLLSSSSSSPPIYGVFSSIRRLRIIVREIEKPSQSSPVSSRFICLFERCLPSLTEISILSIEKIAPNTIEHWQRNILPLRVTNFVAKSFCDAYKLPFSSAVAVAAADSCTEIWQKVKSIHSRAVCRKMWLQERYDFINHDIPIPMVQPSFDYLAEMMSELDLIGILKSFQPQHPYDDFDDDYEDEYLHYL